MQRILISIFILFSAGLYAQQEFDRTISHDGLIREYHLYIPAIYHGNVAVPLLFNLHGMGSNNLQQGVYAYFNDIADTANFIICLPNGTYIDSSTRFWNAGFTSYAVDDIGFLMALADTLYKQYNIDPSRVYFTGMSNGGFMSHTIACTCSDKVAAVASVAGCMSISQYNSCSPVRPVPVMEIHGDADNIVPFYGNAINYLGFSLAIVPTDTLIKSWKNHNSCTGNPVVTALPDINSGDGSTATRYDFTCQSGTSVVLYKIAGGGHTWPGAFAMPANGTTNRDFNACIEIWKFLRQYRNLQSVIGIEVEKNTGAVIYPNPCSNFVQVSFGKGSSGNFFVLTNRDGEAVRCGYIENNGQIFTGDLPQGLYILTLPTDKVLLHYKILKF